jgi:hypothetical protein
MPQNDLDALGPWGFGTSIANGPGALDLSYRNGHWLTALILGGGSSTQSGSDFNGNSFAYPSYNWEIGLQERNYCFEPLPHLWLEPTLSFIFAYSYTQSAVSGGYLHDVLPVPEYYETNSNVSEYFFLGVDYEYFFPFFPAVSLGGGAGYGFLKNAAYVGLSALNPNLSPNQVSNASLPQTGTTFSSASGFSAGDFDSSWNLDLKIYF